MDRNEDVDESFFLDADVSNTWKDTSLGYIE
jgi:hypothetical protein